MHLFSKSIGFTIFWNHESHSFLLWISGALENNSHLIVRIPNDFLQFIGNLD